MTTPATSGMDMAGFYSQRTYIIRCKVSRNPAITADSIVIFSCQISRGTSALGHRI